MKVKLQAPGQGRIRTDRTLIYRLFVDEHMSQAQIARHLGVSEPAVRKQKVKLRDAGYIKEIGNTGLFERGPEAKFFEQAEPILPRVEEPVPADAAARLSNRDGGAVETPPLPPPPPGARDEEVFVPEIEAHMHNGGVIFGVEKVGRIATYDRRRPDGTYEEAPLFRETIKGRNSLWQYDCEFSLPGADWTAHLQLQVYKPKKKPQHAHLRIFPPRVRKTLEEAEALKDYPLQFFEKEVFDILDHLEKYAEYRFHRKDGRRVGRRDGQVMFSFPLPDEIKKIVPPNFAGVEGVDCHMDQSLGKGRPEIESEKLDRITAMLRAKEGFEKVAEDIEDLQGKIGQVDSTVAKIIQDVTDKVDAILKRGVLGEKTSKLYVVQQVQEIYGLLAMLSDALLNVTKAQLASVQVSAAQQAVSRTMEGAATATASKAEEPAPERRDIYSSFYR